jgi:hypothetical protein
VSNIDSLIYSSIHKLFSESIFYVFGFDPLLSGTEYCQYSENKHKKKKGRGGEGGEKCLAESKQVGFSYPIGV